MSQYPYLRTLLFKKKLTALGLSYSTWDLLSYLWHVGSLVVACEVLQLVRSSSLTRD